MKWGAFISITAVVTLIILYEWARLKQAPKKDKIAFFLLLFIVWVLSMFNLQQMAGPVTLVEAIFKPFSQFLEQ